MKMNYAKPTVSVSSNLSEGVYLASGCYTATAYITQTPTDGRSNYVIQLNGVHSGDHTNSAQLLHISFNLPVTYVDSRGTLVNGNGTSSLTIQYNYDQNEQDKIGLGDLTVSADAGLAVVGVQITD